MNLDNYTLGEQKRLTDVEKKVHKDLIKLRDDANAKLKLVKGADTVVNLQSLLYAEGLNEETGLPNYSIAPIDVQEITLDVSDNNLVYKCFRKNGMHVEMKTPWKAIKVNLLKTIRIVPVYIFGFIAIFLILLGIFSEYQPVQDKDIVSGAGWGAVVLMIISLIWTEGLKKRYHVEGTKITLPYTIKITLPDPQILDGLDETEDYVIVLPFSDESDESIVEVEAFVLQVIDIGEEKFFVPFYTTYI